MSIRHDRAFQKEHMPPCFQGSEHRIIVECFADIYAEHVCTALTATISEQAERIAKLEGIINMYAEELQKATAFMQKNAKETT